MKSLEGIDGRIIRLITILFIAMISSIFLLFSIILQNEIILLASYFSIIITYSLLSNDLVSYYYQGLEKYIRENPEKSQMIFWLVIFILFFPALYYVVGFQNTIITYAGLVLFYIVNRLTNLCEKIRKKTKKDKKSTQ